ncbi:MAG: hypothetical protein QXJ75_05280 [Candidatus Bathyarchaeia archaeon]
MRTADKPLNISIGKCRHWRIHPHWTKAGYCGHCRTIILSDHKDLLRNLTHESIHATLHSLRVRDRYDKLPEHVHYLIETNSPQWKVYLYRILCTLVELW